MSWARESERRVASIFRLHVHLQLCSAPSPHVERGPRRRPPRARHWGLEVVQAQAYATRARGWGVPGACRPGRGLPGVAGLARWWPQHAVGDRGWLRGPAERAGRCDGPRPAEGSVRRGWRLLRADRQCGAGPAVALAAAWEGPEDVSGSRNETQRQTGSRVTPAVWECGGPHCVCIRAVRTCYLPKKTE